VGGFVSQGWIATYNPICTNRQPAERQDHAIGCGN